MRDIQEMVDILKPYNHRLILDPNVDNATYSKAEKAIIIGMRVKENRFDFWMTFFHELGHLICNQKGLYDKYHNPDKYFKTWEDTLKHFRKIAVKAEQYVDSIGEKLFKERFPNKKYIRSYRSKKHMKFLKEYYGY